MCALWCARRSPTMKALSRKCGTAAMERIENTMNKKILALAMAAMLLTTATACSNRDEGTANNGTNSTTNDTSNNGANSPSDDLKDAGNELGDAADHVGDAVGDTLESGKDALDNAVDNGRTATESNTNR